MLFPEIFMEPPRGNPPTVVPVQETLANDGDKGSEGQRERLRAGCGDHRGAQTRKPGFGVENEPQAAWSLPADDGETRPLATRKGWACKRRAQGPEEEQEPWRPAGPGWAAGPGPRRPDGTCRRPPPEDTPDSGPGAPAVKPQVQTREPGRPLSSTARPLPWASGGQPGAG